VETRIREGRSPAEKALTSSPRSRAWPVRVEEVQRGGERNPKRHKRAKFTPILFPPKRCRAGAARRFSFEVCFEVGAFRSVGNVGEPAPLIVIDADLLSARFESPFDIVTLDNLLTYMKDDSKISSRH
jgi:hypothetical protein